MKLDDFKRMRVLLTKHEGMKLKPYKCPSGKLTIGLGRNLEDNGISEQEAFHLLANDLIRIDRELRTTFTWFHRLEPMRRDVITSMVYNMGLSNFKEFKKFIRAIEDGKYDLAEKEMLDSVWAKQVPARAKELASMMKTGGQPKWLT